MAGKGEYARTALLFFAASAVAAGGAELMARLFLPEPQVVHIQRAADLEIRRQIELTERYRVELPAVPEQGRGYFFIMTQTGRRLRANTEVVIDNHHISKRRIEIHTNSLGYRGPEISPDPEARILFLGDSIVMGDYLNEQDTFVFRVGELARADQRNWDVVNAGVGGISLKNELSILVETGLSTEPDIVVLGFYLNDFQESPGVYIQNWTLPFFKDSRLLYHALKVANLFRVAEEPKPEISEIREVDGQRVATVKDYRKIYEDQKIRVAGWQKAFEEDVDISGHIAKVDPLLYEGIIANFADWGGAWSPEMWEYISPLLAEFKRLSVEHEFQPLLLCFPVRAQVEADRLFDYPQRRLSQLADELDIPMFDLLPVLRDRRGGEALFYDHCHHTPVGNGLIAEAVYRFMGEYR